jgi:hypothetical protein
LLTEIRVKNTRLGAFAAERERSTIKCSNPRLARVEYEPQRSLGDEHDDHSAAKPQPHPAVIKALRLRVTPRGPEEWRRIARRRHDLEVLRLRRGRYFRSTIQISASDRRAP